MPDKMVMPAVPVDRPVNKLKQLHFLTENNVLFMIST